MGNNKLVFYLFPNPSYIGTLSPFQIGWIANDYSIINVTLDAAIQILQPTVGASIIDIDSATNTASLFVQGSTQNITVYLKITYLNNPPQYFSLCFVQNLSLPTINNLYRNFISYLPKGVYTTSNNPNSPVFCDNTATATTLAQIYDSSLLQTILSDTQSVAFTDLTTVSANLFPNSGNPAWEQALLGTNALYYQSNTNYPALLQLLYQTNINNNTNPYFLAYNISQYINFRLGVKKFVLIGESTINNISASFILNLNKLGQCIFNGGNDFPGVNDYTISIFILADSNVLSNEFKTELNWFIRRLVPPYLLLNVYYTYTADDLHLAYIADTYLGDPRQNNVACIQYNPNKLAQALGYSGISSSGDITDFIVSLSPIPSGNTLTHGTDYTVTITPISAEPIVLPEPIVYYTQFYTQDSILLSTYFDGTNEHFVANTTGTVEINIYLGVIYKNITYTII